MYRQSRLVPRLILETPGLVSSRVVLFEYSGKKNIDFLFIVRTWTARFN